MKMKRKRTMLFWLVGIAGLGLLYGCSGVFPPENPPEENPPENPPSGTTATIPAKEIELNLIGIHDSDSASFNGNCVGCHGDRTDEVALDGVTPTAHAKMLTLFGSENDRCVSCHDPGPDFFAYSAAALREQVDITSCSSCHGAGQSIEFYDK